MQLDQDLEERLGRRLLARLVIVLADVHTLQPQGREDQLAQPLLLHDPSPQASAQLPVYD